MRAIIRAEHNFVYRGPSEDVADLSVVRFVDHEDALVIRSHWRPSAEELALLNAGGSIELDVFAAVLPPVRLNAVEPTDGEREQPPRMGPTSPRFPV